MLEDELGPLINMFDSDKYHPKVMVENGGELIMKRQRGFFLNLFWYDSQSFTFEYLVHQYICYSITLPKNHT